MADFVSLKWEGLLEMKEELRKLPAELAKEGDEIIHRRGQEAADEIRENYMAHFHTGNLADSVIVTSVSSGQFGAGVEVRAKAKHAHLFEFGTAARHTTRSDADRGVMPPAPPIHAFIPVMERTRRKLYEEDLVELLARAGLEASGNAD